ncbi:ABC transporter permease subunit [Georgenia sp. SYP-B2076]|uniref:ABC transporter permease subunit n=1 Tax=Georgenia sp. SYP-B2076 TaxID=2495881 RepID=UPI000F8D1383|nr:ABC transporter permease subunit [Georgenia sp. SYP-B2076]
MTRLTKVEVRRLFSRRLVVLAMVAGLLVSALALVGVWQQSRPMSAAEQRQAAAYYEQAVADWEENGETWFADCLDAQAAEREATGTDVDYGCQNAPPQEADFYRAPPPLEQTMPSLLSMHANLLIFLALLVGATATAAELSTGALGTWLTFEPRRLRVYGSKVLASGAGVLPFAVLAIVVVVVGAWAIAAAVGQAGGMTGAAWSDTRWTAGRVAAITAVSAMVGAALGILLRHTAAVLGAVVGYVVVVEGILGGLFRGTQPWLLTTNIRSWTDNGTTYPVEDCTTDGTGTMCSYVEHTLSFGHSVAYLLALAAVLIAVVALVFRRRDVS